MIQYRSFPLRKTDVMIVPSTFLQASSDFQTPVLSDRGIVSGSDALALEAIPSDGPISHAQYMSRVFRADILSLNEFQLFVESSLSAKAPASHSFHQLHSHRRDRSITPRIVDESPSSTVVGELSSASQSALNSTVAMDVGLFSSVTAIQSEEVKDTSFEVASYVLSYILASATAITVDLEDYVTIAAVVDDMISSLEEKEKLEIQVLRFI